MENIPVITTTIVGIYLLIVLGIGFFGWRKLQINVTDFFVVNRSLGVFVIFLTMSATYHSAFAVLTSTAVATAQGVGWFVGATAWTVTAGFCMWIFGIRFWYLGNKFGYVTLADPISDFFQNKGIRGLIAIVTAGFAIPYVAVQSVAFGLFAEIGTVGLISYEWGSFILTFVALLYCVFAGHRAVAWTDVLQGIWMFVMVWIVSILIVYSAIGGIGELFAEISREAPEMLGVAGTGWSHPLNLFSSTVLFTLGLMVTFQHLQMKFYSAMDPATIKWSGVWTTIYLSAIYIPPVLTGMAAYIMIQRGALPSVDEIAATWGSTDAVLPLMAVEYVPAVLVGLLFAGAVAAAMSTKDNFLLATSLVIVRDLYQGIIKPDAGERESVGLGRVVIVVVGLFGWYIGILRPGLIFDMVALAVGGTLQFIVAVVAVLFPTRKLWLSHAGAVAGIVVGVILTILLTWPDRFGLAISAHPYALNAALWGLGFNIIVALVVSSFTAKPPAESVERIHGYLEESFYKKPKEEEEKIKT